MEIAKAITFLLLLILHIFPAVYGANITVGGNSGWTIGFDYDSWTKGQVFITNDVLLFNYGPSHSVEEVSADDYENCNTNDPIASHSLSPTSIPLYSTGTRYFICPTSNHCSRGMKLVVTVTANLPPPPTASTPAPPPRTTSSPPPGKTPTPSPSIAPKSSPPRSTTPPPISSGTRSPPPSGSPLAPTNTPPPVPSHGTIISAGPGRNGMLIGILLVIGTLFGLIG